MDGTIISKYCTKCQETKPITEFSKDKSRKDGLMSHCKLCRQAYHHENAERINARRVELYKKNPDIIRMRDKAYREANLEEINKRARLRYWANPKKFNIRDKEYRKNNSEKIKEHERNRSKTKARKDVKQKSNHKRRALKRNAVIENFSPMEIFQRDGYICQICKRKTRPDFKDSNHPLYPTIDHIVPLSLGGEHSKINTQCACRLCNSTKSNLGVGDQLRMFG